MQPFVKSTSTRHHIDQDTRAANKRGGMTWDDALAALYPGTPAHTPTRGLDEYPDIARARRAFSRVSYNMPLWIGIGSE